MCRHGAFRQACGIAAVLVGLVFVASAHTIEIKFDPGGAAANGTINFNWFTDSSTGFAGLVSTKVNVRAGWTGANLATFTAAILNTNPAVSFAYTATTGTETVQSIFGPVVTYDTVTITPVAGVGQDFDFGSFYVMPTSDPKLSGGGIKIYSTAPGTTSLQLTTNGPQVSGLNIDWTLFAVNQSGAVDGVVTLTGIPDTTSASALLGMFDSSLLSQGLPAVANGNTLSLTTADNDFFALSRSTAGSLDYRISDLSPVPEPGTIALFGGGLLGLAWSVRRKLRGNA